MKKIAKNKANTVKSLLWEEVRGKSVAKGMLRMMDAFPKVEQRVYCHILMEAVGWAWVRDKKREDVNWTSVLKGSDDSAKSDSLVAFAVEQPFCPRGACDNCFEKIKIPDKKEELKIRTHPRSSL